MLHGESESCIKIKVNWKCRFNVIKRGAASEMVKWKTGLSSQRFIAALGKNRGFDSKGQANVSACPVWMHTQINTTNIIFTRVHNTNIHKKYVHKLSTNLTLYSLERLVIFILAYYCSTTYSKAVREIIEEFQCLIKSSKFCSINF